MEKETITLMIEDNKCYIPLESLNDAVSNTLFELVKNQQEQINMLMKDLIHKNKEIDLLNKIKKEGK